MEGVLDEHQDSFLVWGGGHWEEWGAGRDNRRGTGEEVFVLALWMHIRVKLNCQLTRFPNHVFPLKSRPPTDLIPRQQQEAKLPSSIPKGQRIPRTSARRVRIISTSGISNGLYTFMPWHLAIMPHSYICLG